MEREKPKDYGGALIGMTVLLSFLSIIALAVIGYSSEPTSAKETVKEEESLEVDAHEPVTESEAGGGVTESVDNGGSGTAMVSEDTKEESPVINPRVKVKAIYLSGWGAGSVEKLSQLLNLINDTELNAVVVDLKDDTGYLTYQSEVVQARNLGSNSSKIRDLPGLVRKLRTDNIYPIARIVVFKDQLLSEKIFDLAIKNKEGGYWRDNKGKVWADPYSKEVWDYNLAIAEEAAQMGFREVQFDYVRFPSDGKIGDTIFSHDNGLSKEETIAAFLTEAGKLLKKYNVYVSADVFGLTTSTVDGMRIGQKWESVSPTVDYISPMVYPSHYAPGSYGLADPNSKPYETVFRSLSDGVKRNQEDWAVIRPWLQDFTLGYNYSAKEVRDQIQATYDVGLEEWILWNPKNVYTEEALLTD